MKAGSSSRKSLVAISLLWFGSLAGAGLAFITQVVLARELTPAGYGVFAAALATTTLLAPLAGFGVQGFWLKTFGEEGWGAVRLLTPSFRFVILSTAVTLLLLAGWAAWGPHDASFRWLLYWLLPVVAGHLFIELVSGKLQLEERYTALALWQLLPHLARLLLVLVVVFNATVQPGLDTIGAAYALGAITMMIAGFPQLQALAQGRFALKGHPKLDGTESMDPAMAPPLVRVSDIARQAWPFGLSGVFYLVYFQSAVILLKYLAGGEAAGIYSVAFTVMMAVYLFPGIIYQKFLLPKFHRWANHDRARFLEVYRVGNGSMLLLGVLTTIAMLLLVPWIVPLLFGKVYQEAVGLLAILVFCIPVRFLAISIGATLVTQEHMQRKIGYMGTVAVVNVLLNLLLIPHYGTQGAAVATQLSEITLLVLYLLGVRQHVFGSDAWRGWNIGVKKNSGASNHG